MEFEKNKLIKKTLREYYALFNETTNTGNFVPEKYNKKILKFIYKNMNKKFNEIHIYYLLNFEHKGLKLGLINKFRIWLSGLRPIFNLELQEQEKKQQKRQEIRKKQQIKKFQEETEEQE